MLNKVNRSYGFAFLWIVMIAIQMILPLYADTKASINGNQANLSGRSKAELVAETRHIMRQVKMLEAKAGQTEPGGYTIYSPSVTGQLWELYQQAGIRLDILNHGTVSKNTEFDGYLPSAEAVANPYNTAQVRRAMADLQAKIPAQFLQNYRIFLAPLALSGVSGQGGAGFGIIYALPESFKATEDDLRVTLYHELGHHIHLSYMPTQTANGKALWEEYLNFRGGSWHEDGKVNTTDWSSSSEETFAEDFRMIYGNDQPYFGDMALGDPRTQSGTTETFRKFVGGLVKATGKEAYQSPWIPGGYWFWLHQEWLIRLMWFAVPLLGLVSGGRYRTVSAARMKALAL